MAFFKELKESKRERRKMQVKILLVIAVIEGLVWYFSKSMNVKIVISILVIVIGAYLIFAQTDYWRIRQWKRGHKREEKSVKQAGTEAQQRIEKEHQAEASHEEHSNKVNNIAGETAETKEPLTSTMIVDGKDLVFGVEDVKFKMKYVPAGSFMMGEGNPNVISHKVALDHDFWIGETLVTQALWKAVMGNNPSIASLNLDNAPVGNVSWQDCEKFIDKLNEGTNQSFFFPTEAQWEFAARGGALSKGYKYSGSDNIDEVAWYWDNCDKKVHAVKTKKPNELGTFDMSGLSWEWCYDWAADYDVEDDCNPIGPDITDTLNFIRRGIKNKIIRGGCMENNAPACATTARGQLHPCQRHPLVGLRLAISSVKGDVKTQLESSGDSMETHTANSDARTSGSASAPDLETTSSVIWMAHCINLPFLPMNKNMEINMEFIPMLNDFKKAVKDGDKNTTIGIYNKFQDKMKEKLGNDIANPMMHLQMVPFKICALSKDLLDLYKMVIEGQKNENVLNGGAIKRILKYSIELGSPAKTLDALTDYFVNNAWFDDMQEQIEWHKLALECMMVTGNGGMGTKILGILQNEGGISDDEKEELLNHAKEFRSQINASWM